ncbi:hypothetical protein AQUCO_02000153v1 [Aquilegia coerulea]|uniref:Uncharacterized protein n=1 Tax=Aquilegia coerulea TaxID=218851 RepID=A0A2G5DG52_AQUCA|nr:hypothetical protein AQUCO_02000153v1 [Aquilegia coerulea]
MEAQKQSIENKPSNGGNQDQKKPNENTSQNEGCDPLKKMSDRAMKLMPKIVQSTAQIAKDEIQRLLK